ncbi:MAG TPA: MraY family glycosyltransferase [Candidatus Gracilibacteria bacterium]|nr:MraY family glycosyltransferase [Candidatus Gracilibacteria bacterium]
MFLVLGITLLASLLAVYLVKYFFPRWGLLDRPQDYGYTRAPVPYPAGILIPLVFFAVVWTVFPMAEALIKPMIGFSIAAGLLLIISFLDDRYKISPLWRLMVQFLAAGIVIAFGVGIDEMRSFSGELWDLNRWVILLGTHRIVVLADMIALFWMVMLINSMNWLDGVSGLPSSLGTITSLVLAITAYFFGQADIALLFGILTVICAVFFIFDLESPKILMGDSGSMFLGLALAVFTIIAGGKIAALMCVLFAPLFDAIWTIFRRLKAGKKPWQGDLGHLHHKLLKIFPTRRITVLFYAGMTAFFGLGAIFFKTQGKMIWLAGLTIFLVFLEIYLDQKK